MLCIVGDPRIPLPHHPKVRRFTHADRPTYSDIFRIVNDRTGHADLNIFANADCWLDYAATRRLRTEAWSGVLALSRWEQPTAEPSFIEICVLQGGSQDAWVWRGRMELLDADYLPGTPGCDNRLLRQLAPLGPYNPGLDIRLYHLHNSGVRPWLGTKTPPLIPGPYGFTRPTKLHHPERVLDRTIAAPPARYRG